MGALSQCDNWVKCSTHGRVIDILPSLHSSAYTLNERFSLEKCSFVEKDEVVLFSPATTTTLLCHPSALQFLELLEASSGQAALADNTEVSEELISELLTAEIIEMKP